MGQQYCKEDPKNTAKDPQIDLTKFQTALKPKSTVLRPPSKKSRTRDTCVPGPKIANRLVMIKIPIAQGETMNEVCTELEFPNFSIRLESTKDLHHVLPSTQLRPISTSQQSINPLSIIEEVSVKTTPNRCSNAESSRKHRQEYRRRSFVRSQSQGSIIEAQSVWDRKTVSSRPSLVSREDKWFSVGQSWNEIQTKDRPVEVSIHQLAKDNPRYKGSRHITSPSIWKEKFKSILKTAESQQDRFKFLLETFPGDKNLIYWWTSEDNQVVYLGQGFVPKDTNNYPPKNAVRSRSPLNSDKSGMLARINNIVSVIRGAATAKRLIFEGRGYLLQHNTFHSGYFRNGRREGPGQLILLGPAEAVYNGFWNADEMEGLGTLNTQSGYQYIGEWLHSQQHGKGREMWPDGSSYNGQFVAGERTGTGEYVQPTNEDCPDPRAHRKSEAVLKSQVINNIRAGQRQRLSRYVGGFFQGLFEGFGTMEYASGDVFIGHWSAGRKHGKCKYVWSDGSYFVGDYQNGRRVGTGLFCEEF